MLRISRFPALAGLAAIAISRCSRRRIVGADRGCRPGQTASGYNAGDGQSFGPLGAILKGESTDFAAAATSAETINTNALRIPAIFLEGTGRDASPETRAKPEVWSERSTFEANAQKLAEESAKLIEVAQTEDPEAYQTQFQALGKACDACHASNPAEGGPFRFAADE